MYKRAAGLVREDRPERPGNRDTRGEVTLRGGECICSCCGFEEEEREEDEDFGPDSGPFF